MRTELSSIGKVNAISKLFEGTKYTNTPSVTFTKRVSKCHAHSVLLEGVDFDLVYVPLKHLGYKAVLSAFGDLYAKLHTPYSLSVKFGLSSRFCYEDVQELWKGVLAAAEEHGVEHLALDLIPSVNGLCISLSTIGVQKEKVIASLPESKNMDLICLTGDVGAAYMGLHFFEREKVAFLKSQEKEMTTQAGKYKHILESYLSPQIKPDILDRFFDDKIFPAKGYFVSKGLGSAILQLTQDTGYGAKVYLERIPISSRTFAMAEEINMDPITAAMNGGDDYKFIFTIPIEKHEEMLRDFQDYDIIGHLAQPEVGAAMVTPEGAEIPIRAQGF